MGNTAERVAERWTRSAFAQMPANAVALIFNAAQPKRTGPRPTGGPSPAAPAGRKAQPLASLPCNMRQSAVTAARAASIATGMQHPSARPTARRRPDWVRRAILGESLTLTALGLRLCAVLRAQPGRLRYSARRAGGGVGWWSLATGLGKLPNPC